MADLKIVSATLDSDDQTEFTISVNGTEYRALWSRINEEFELHTANEILDIDTVADTHTLDVKELEDFVFDFSAALHEHMKIAAEKFASTYNA